MVKQHITPQILKAGLAEFFLLSDISQTRFAVAVKEDLFLTVDFEKGTGLVIITGKIAPSPKERQEELFELLLTFNISWAETGGMSMSLGEPDDSLYLTLETAVNNLDSQKIVNVIASFAQRVELWRNVVNKFSEGASIEDLSFTEMSSEMFIKV